MVTRAEFREVVGARAEGRPIDPLRLVTAAREPAPPSVAEQRDRRLVSVLLTDDELERLQVGRA